MKTLLRAVAILVCWLAAITTVSAEPLRIAVAANFSSVLKEIAARYTDEFGQAVKTSTASTGTIYAQILNGAPYDLFLAADAERPLKLEQKGLARKRFTYAVGQLVLWAPNASMQVDETWLRQFAGRLAIANPELAPYGAAAMDVIKHLGVTPATLVKGSNVAQTWQFVHSGNVDAGFVALSQVKSLTSVQPSSYWIVPHHYYRVIQQQAVILSTASPDAERFAAFLRSRPVRDIIGQNGYLTSEPAPWKNRI